jgi:hypothetical protein
VEVTALTGTCHSEGHARRVPRADARNLAQTAMRLARQALDAPSCNHTLHALALGHADDVKELVLSEHGVHLDLLLEQTAQ